LQVKQQEPLTFLLAKKEENVEKVPTLTTLVESTGNSCTKTDITKAENIVLNALNWDLKCISPSHFLEFFLQQDKGDTIKGEEISKEVRKRIESFSNVFIEACLSDCSMINQFLPSKVAAASIYTARMVCGVDVKWTVSLEERTGYTENDLSKCYQMLFNFYSAP
jgi:hypothetical protein